MGSWVPLAHSMVVNLPIKAALIDALDTLLDPSGSLRVGCKELLSGLEASGVPAYIVSNDTLTAKQRDQIPVQKGMLLSGDDYGKKGRGKLVDEVVRREQVKTNELLYLGNSDFDVREASNKKIVLLSARWATEVTNYGVHCSSPADALDCVRTFFLKDHLWYAKVSQLDPLKRPVEFRSLMSSDDADRLGLKRLLKQDVKGKDIQGVDLDSYLTLHLFASAYLEGLHADRGPKDEATWWCVFPGHSGTINAHLKQVIDWTTSTLKTTHREDLIVRHKDAVKKAYARYNGKAPDIDNDFNTLMVNPQRKATLKGRTVIILDDFSTEAHGFETARNLLLAAGASKVYGLSVGKFGRGYPIRYPKPGARLPICVACDVEPQSLGTEMAAVTFDPQALDYYK